MSRSPRIKVVVGLLVVGIIAVAAGIFAAENQAKHLESHVRALTSPNMEGRGNRTQGLDQARDYIIEEMKRAGLEPAGDDGFKQPVDVVVDAQPTRNVELRLGDEVLAQGHQFAVAGFSGSGSFEAPVVFAGYGISAPQQGWDDYDGLDVRGRVVLVLTGQPGPEHLSLDAPSEGHLATPKAKAAVALARGADAIILINDPRTYGGSSTQRPDVLPKFWPAHELDGISAAFATARVARKVLGADFETRRKTLESSPDEARGPLGVDASGDLSLERKTRTLFNIVGRLPGSPASAPPLVVGAHYDGLGLGEPGSLSEYTAQHIEQLHPGADDNASGVAVLLGVAQTLVDQGLEPNRPVLFAALVSEELGLRGSRVMANRLRHEGQPGVMVNMDMVGRLEERSLHVALDNSSGGLLTAIQRAAASHGLELEVEGLRERRSDHISFSEAGFDAASLTTGRHVDYHMPTDAPEKLNPEGMVTVHDFLVDVVEALTR